MENNEKYYICSKCKKRKLLNKFIKDKRRKSGRGVCCYACARKAESDRIKTPEGKAAREESIRRFKEKKLVESKAVSKIRRASKIELIKSYKNNPCVDCRFTFPSECMELDHVLGAKIAHVSRMKDLKVKRIIAEIKKCEAVCANCHRIRTANRRDKSKNKTVLAFREMIEQIKSVPCADCFQIFQAAAMDFDHIRGIKLFNISDMWHCSNEVIMEELNKCEVVCANCHRIRSQNNLNKDLK